MATYPIERLFQLWSRGEVTVEQVIGQLIQQIQQLETRLRTLERTVQRDSDTTTTNA